MPLLYRIVRDNVEYRGRAAGEVEGEERGAGDHKRPAAGADQPHSG